MSIPVEDVRRAVEGQAKSHLIHLREALPRVARRDDAHRAADRGVGRAAARAAHAHRAAARRRSADRPTATAVRRIARRRWRKCGWAFRPALIRTVLASSAGGHSTIADPSHLLARYIDASQRDLGVRGPVASVIASRPNADAQKAVGAADLLRRLASWPLCLVATLRRARSPRRRALTDTVNDFASVIDAGSRAELDKRIRALKEATGDVARRRHRADVPALRQHRGIRRQDVRERRARHRRQGQGQRPAARRRGGRSQGEDRSRLRPRRDRPRRLRRADDPRGDRAGVPRGDYGEGLLAATTRLINRIGEQRGVTIPDVPGRARGPRPIAAEPVSPGS